jgi:hypothetical protein
MTSLAEVEWVFKLKAEGERAYLASPQYQKMLRALEFLKEQRGVWARMQCQSFFLWL